VTVQIKIEGMDRNWISLPPGGSRTLTTLRDGAYTVRARSLGQSGLATEAPPLHFQVEPPAWRSLPAIGAYGLLVLLVGFGAFRTRTRTLRRRNLELEALVKKGVAHAERASAAKTDFVSRISHDLRNPLHSISGITLKLSETELNDQQRELVAALRDCSDYVTVLVDGVLDFAQIEAGKVELRPVLFSPTDALRSVCANLKWAPDSEKSDFVLEIDPAVPERVFADPGRVQEVLINLASNAVKYAPGRISLGVKLVSPSDDAVGAVEFFVQDEGPGLSGDEIKLIFDKFERTSRARTKDGAGLGLAVAKQLAALMGGNLAVESQVGKGARFYLRLPLPTLVTPPTELAPVHLFQSVLLVEDAQYSAWATEAVLARLGMTVTEVARTGQQAVEKFSAGTFDLVLLDHNLPDMDGLKVAQLIRQSERNGTHTTIIAVTAFTTPEERQACLKAGMDGFAGKPLTPTRLTQALAEASAANLAAGPVTLAPEAIKPGLEPAYLQFLSEGTPGSLAAQVDRYCDTLNADFAQMRQAQQLSDWGAMASLAHQMVAHARVVNALALAESAERLRKSARASQSEGIAEDLHRVGDEIDYVVAQIKEWPSVQSIV
jgi:signal transduction histidine kinase/CheY-like chemotaxis protein/HPt (histidine-containing phosphotransfer) domain-containing protein